MRSYKPRTMKLKHHRNPLTAEDAHLIGSKKFKYVLYHQLSPQAQRQARAAYPHRSVGAKYAFRVEDFYYPVTQAGQIPRGTGAQRVLRFSYADLLDDAYMASQGYQVSSEWKHNPRYKATFDSDTDSTGVKRALKAAGFKGARVRGGEKRKPGPYALFVRKHMPEMKAKGLSMGEAMKAIGELWRVQKGGSTARANPRADLSVKDLKAQGYYVKQIVQPSSAGYYGGAGVTHYAVFGPDGKRASHLADTAQTARAAWENFRWKLGAEQASKKNPWGKRRRNNPDLGITYQVIPAPIPNPSLKVGDHVRLSANGKQAAQYEMPALAKADPTGIVTATGWESGRAVQVDFPPNGVQVVPVRWLKRVGGQRVRGNPSSKSGKARYAAMKGAKGRRKNPMTTRDLPTSGEASSHSISDPYRATITGTLDSVNPTGGTVTIDGKGFRLIDPRYWDTGASARAYKAALSKQKLVGRRIHAEVEYHHAFGWTIFGGSKIKLAGRSNPRGFKVWTVTFHLAPLGEVEGQGETVRRQVKRWGGKLKRGKGYVATFPNRDDAYQAQKGAAAWGVTATVEEGAR